MGMDAVFVNMVENYYITNMCTWIDSTQLKKIIERAEKDCSKSNWQSSPQSLLFMADLL